MKIRAITSFIDPSYPPKATEIIKAGYFLTAAQNAFSEGGYEVQSFRLACTPFTSLLPDFNPGRLADFASRIEALAAEAGFAYVSLGPAYAEATDSFDAIPAALTATQYAFLAGNMTTLDGQVSLAAIHACARVIQEVSTILPNGFGNLRFAALANVPAESPFFPAAYHQGGEAGFAIATEAADLAIDAFSRAATLEEGRSNLVKAMEAHADHLSSIAHRVEKLSQVRFSGIDFSLAPFPEENCSLGCALEGLGVPTLGGHGSMAAATILADTMDRARFERAGFSGLFLPVLEDTTLAMRAAEGSLGVKDLLLYSAVCGTGLDCIPLPGDTSIEELMAVLLDLASLSSRLGKPLTARLMPIPNKKAGDLTDFEFAYFANSRVLPLFAKPLQGLLSGGESFSLHRRGK